MLVQNWMSQGVVGVRPDQTIPQAAGLMEDNRIGRVVVTDRGRLVGIISKSDIERARFADAPTLELKQPAEVLNQVPVTDIMTPHPHTVAADDTVEDAALKMMKHDIGALPVVDATNKAVGMLTKGDVFRALVTLSGVTREGVQFALDLPDQFGAIKRATDLIRSFGGRIVSILTSYNQAEAGRCRAYIRTRELDRDLVPDVREQLTRVGRLLYLVDNREGLREMFTVEWQTLRLTSETKADAGP